VLPVGTFAAGSVGWISGCAFNCNIEAARCSSTRWPSTRDVPLSCTVFDAYVCAMLRVLSTLFLRCVSLVMPHTLPLFCGTGASLQRDINCTAFGIPALPKTTRSALLVTFVWYVSACTAICESTALWRTLCFVLMHLLLQLLVKRRHSG
jgi:hypothetical protein